MEEEEGKTENFTDILPEESQLPQVQTIKTEGTQEEFSRPHPPTRKKKDTLKRENPFNQPIRESWSTSKMDGIQIDFEKDRFLQPVIALGFDDIFVQPEPLNYGPKFPKKCQEINEVFKKIYAFISLGVYTALSLVFGTLLMIFWAILMAICKFIIVFLLQPSSIFSILVVRILSVIWKSILDSFVTPTCKAFANIFGSFSGKFSLYTQDASLQQSTNKILDLKGNAHQTWGYTKAHQHQAMLY